MLLIPREREDTHKLIALVTSVATLVVGAGIVARFIDIDTPGELVLTVDKNWIEVINSRYIVGIDGISLPLLILSMFIVVLVVLYSWDHFPAPHNPKAFLILTLVLETGMNGTFV